MTIRIHLLAALLAVGAALGASPVLAADAVAGNRGPAEKPHDRAAPATLPAATPMPTPTLDPTTLSRGFFAQDPAAAIAGLASVTLSNDGTVTETPASEALRDAFTTAIQGRRP